MKFPEKDEDIYWVVTPKNKEYPLRVKGLLIAIRLRTEISNGKGHIMGEEMLDHIKTITFNLHHMRDKNY